MSLTSDPSYLDRLGQNPSVPVNITIPDGNHKGQSKRIYIRGEKLATTETFILSGNFAGFTSLTFDGVGFSAVLEWDGSSSWLFLAGNAAQNP